MIAGRLVVLVACTLGASEVYAGSGGPGAAPRTGGTEVVVLPSPESPIVAIRLLFTVGSVHDPAGKEGLASLTALMVAEGGSARRTYSEVVEALYPMAASVASLVDRETTVFAGEVHRERLAEYTTILTEVLLQPGFRPADLERHRERLLAHLTTTLRSASDEHLGLEALQQRVFAGHPYEHAAAGTVHGLRAITVEDVQEFYRRHYTEANLIIGIAGGYPQPFVSELQATLSRLGRGRSSLRTLPKPEPVDGRHATLIQKDTDSVGIHFGYPVNVRRTDADYYPLMVANSYLGEHRTFHGRLMQQMRGLRGLNYGNYSYIEHWHNPPGTTNPTPNVPRRQQYFSVWIRPVVPGNALFAFRNAIDEVNRVIERGLTPEEFAITREFLTNYSKLWAQSLSDRLGFLLDSRFYGTPFYIDEIERRLAALTVDDVNRAIRQHLQTASFEAVFVTGDAPDLRERLEEDLPSPMTYRAAVPDEVAEADRRIERLPLALDSIRIVPVSEMFER